MGVLLTASMALDAGGGGAIAPFLTKKLPYDPVQYSVPVTLVSLAALLVTAHPSPPVKSAS